MGGGRSILLVGLMGAGKSTVGPALAARLGRDFVDTDAAIEAREGRSIATIFADDGEPGFRAIESKLVADAAAGDAVLALGGGAVSQPGAPERLAGLGTLVYLRARPETLLARIGDPSGRPLLAGLDAPGQLARLRDLLAERRDAYERARVIVDTDGREVAAIVEEIARRLPDAEPAR